MKLVSQNDEQPLGNDVFNDLESLRQASTLKVKRKSVLVNVPVDKPPSNSYFRVHPTWVLDDATVVKDSEGSDRTYYFVVPSMRSCPKLLPRLRRVTLAVISIWPADTVQIWPVPILGDRDFKVWKSARAAQLATGDLERVRELVAQLPNIAGQIHSVLWDIEMDFTPIDDREEKAIANRRGGKIRQPACPRLRHRAPENS
jgi:hypothetical protein